MLTAELGIDCYFPLNTNTTCIPGGVTVTRVKNGDLPDWIAWDLANRCYVLCEAKGRLSEPKGRFLCGKPDCIDVGKAQFDRVEVRDTGGRLVETRDWIAANLWATERVPRSPVALLWDPPGRGATLTQEEAERHADALRRHRDADIKARLGNPDRAVRIAVKPSDDPMGSAAVAAAEDSGSRVMERPSREPHEGEYLAAVITSVGVQSIRDEDDLGAVHMARDRAASTGEPAVIFGIGTAGSQATKAGQMPWLSGNGIASPDGLSLFNLADVEVTRS